MPYRAMNRFRLILLIVACVAPGIFSLSRMQVAAEAQQAGIEQERQQLELARKSHDAAVIGESPDLELLGICSEAKAHQMRLYATLQTASEKERYSKLESAYAEQIQQLEEFEAQHRGTTAGLMAFRQIVQIAARGGPPDSEMFQARRRVVQNLDAYVGNELLPSAVKAFEAGSFDQQVVNELQRLEALPQTPRFNQQYLALTRAKALLQGRNQAIGLPLMVAAVKAKVANGDDAAFLSATFERMAQDLPAKESLDQQLAEAMKELRTIACDVAGESICQTEPVDDQSIVVRRASSKPRVSIAESCEAFLFRETSFGPGKPAPALDVELLSGKRWKLADQRGKLVVIQFSFQGCGPCEAMYPKLAALQQDYADQVSVLTFLADEHQEDSVAAVTSGKITWPAAWDAPESGLVRRWSVEAFPQLFLVDASGNWADPSQLPEELRERIQSLEE